MPPVGRELVPSQTPELQSTISNSPLSSALSDDLMQQLGFTALNNDISSGMWVTWEHTCTGCSDAEQPCIFPTLHYYTGTRFIRREKCLGCSSVGRCDMATRSQAFVFSVGASGTELQQVAKPYELVRGGWKSVAKWRTSSWVTPRMTLYPTGERKSARLATGHQQYPWRANVFDERPSRVRRRNADVVITGYKPAPRWSRSTNAGHPSGTAAAASASVAAGQSRSRTARAVRMAESPNAVAGPSRLPAAPATNVRRRPNSIRQAIFAGHHYQNQLSNERMQALGFSPVDNDLTTCMWVANTFPCGPCQAASQPCIIRALRYWPGRTYIRRLRCVGCCDRHGKCDKSKNLAFAFIADSSGTSLVQVPKPDALLPPLSWKDAQDLHRGSLATPGAKRPITDDGKESEGDAVVVTGFSGPSSARAANSVPSRCAASSRWLSGDSVRPASGNTRAGSSKSNRTAAQGAVRGNDAMAYFDAVDAIVQDTIDFTQRTPERQAARPMRNSPTSTDSSCYEDHPALPHLLKLLPILDRMYMPAARRFGAQGSASCPTAEQKRQLARWGHVALELKKEMDRDETTELSMNALMAGYIASGMSSGVKNGRWREAPDLTNTRVLRGDIKHDPW